MRVECNGYSVSLTGSTLRVADPWNSCSMELDAEACRQLAKVLMAHTEAV